MKRFFSIVWKITGWLLLLPVLFVILLQTPPGKKAAAAILSGSLSTAEHMDVRITGLSGWIPARINVDALEVGDAAGTWLRLEGVSCRWMIRELLNDRITFRELSARTIEWRRFPASGNRSAEKKNGGFEPVEIRLEELKVKHLRVDGQVAGTPLEYAVSSGGIVYQTDGGLSGELEVRGDAEGLIRLNASIAGAGENFLKLNADLSRMNHPTFGLDTLAGRGEALINAAGVQAELSAELAKGERQGRITTQLHYAGRRLTLSRFTFSAPEFSLAGNLGLGFRKGGLDVELDSAFSDVSTNRCTVRGRAAVATGGPSWRVDVQSLELSGREVAVLDLTGSLSPEQVALQGALRPFDISTLPLGGCSNFTGRVTGTVSVSGSLEKPEVKAGVSVSKLAGVQDALDELPELDLNIAGGIADGRLFGTTAVTNYASGRLEARVSMPCAFSLRPFTWQPAAKALEAQIEGDLDLASFNQLAILQNQRLHGMLQTRVDYAGGSPSGFLRVKNGRYEHYDLGILFQDFNADFEATPEGLAVKSATATDGGTGTLSLAGGLNRSGLDLVLGFERARILRRDEVDATLSGLLAVKGSPLRPDLSGELTVDRAEILLDNIAPAPPPLLTDYDAAETNLVGRAVEKPRRPPPVGLDIKVVLPEQVFVVASMIEAVLEGELHITDAPRGVSVTGRIEPRRGFVNFIGKKFRFVEGDILLDGSIPPVAVFNNLAAEYARHDVTARLLLNGPVNDPRFRLESSPPMPEDEVLSQVLFNRDTSSISPYQAYQIAMAARQLSGGLNGPGFMYQIRQAIGVDTLEWREADAVGGASSVAAGKYIGYGLYVEVNRELDSQGQTGMSAEYEVTRHFSVETYTGPKMRPGIGINWRNDY